MTVRSHNATSSVSLPVVMTKGPRGRRPWVVALHVAGSASLLLLVCHACSPFNEAASAEAPDAASSDSSYAGSDSSYAVADASVASGASCSELLAQRPELRGKNDVYTIESRDAGAVRVYCDMTLDDGGWTLVGRSATYAPATPSFGWRSSMGKVDDFDRPYSLNAVAVGLEFSELLVATNDVKTAYKFMVSPGFLELEDELEPTGDVVVVAGDCNAQPTMLKYAGMTSLTDKFFLRDVRGVESEYGLTSRGFELAYRECDKGGHLHEAQGVIMVR